MTIKPRLISYSPARLLSRNATMSEVVSHVRNAIALVAKRFAVRGWAVVLLCLASTSLYGRTTWKLIHQFDRSIGCAYFFDENHGLIGSGVRPAGYFDAILGAFVDYQGAIAAIYRTTDGGVTWTQSAVPVQVYGAVTQICMVDSMRGYASLFSDSSFDLYQTFGKSCIWETTDGGVTWFDSMHLDHIATSVYAQPGLLVFTKWDYYYQTLNTGPIDLSGGGCSFDGGVSWTKNFYRGNGVAFSDSLNGVVTEMNSWLGGGNFWITTDAGRSWQQSVDNQYEAWSVHAVRGQHIFLCANESQHDLPYTYINWSTDSGFAWSERAYFPVMHFTGDIEGVGNTLYIQTDSTDWGDIYQTGLYRSDDLGATWHWVGGPTNSRDTRFAVTGCEGQVVYAFDGLGGVWKTSDGGDGTLGPSIAFAEPDSSIAFAADTIRWVPKACGDTLNFEALCSSCIPVSIDSAAIFWGTELFPVPELGTLPAALQQYDSARISVAYVPTKGGVQGTIVRVFAHNGEESFYKDITIVTTNTQKNSIALSKDTCSLSVSGCKSAIDSVNIFDAGCSGLVVDSIIMPESDVAIVDSLPAISSDSVPVRLLFLYQPRSSEAQTIRVHLYAHEGFRSFDTILTLELQSTVAPPSFALDSTSYTIFTNLCHPGTSRIPLSAVSCDSVWIDSIVSSNPHFIFWSDSVLVPNIRDSLRLAFNPDSAGTQLGTVRIVAHNAYQSFDTTIAVSGTNNARTNCVILSQAAVSLATAHCQPIQDTVLITNPCCDSLWIDSIRVSDNSGISIAFDSTLLPLPSGDALPLRIVFNPLDGNSRTSVVNLFMHAGSKSFDTVLVLSTSNNIPAHPLSLSKDSLYLFTKYCQPISAPIVITDSGCQSITIDTEVILNDTLGEFKAFNFQKVFNTTDTSYINFSPGQPGNRFVKLKVSLEQGTRKFDTILSVAAKNLTAPVPFIPPLASQGAGTVLSIPIMLEPTADTFSIRRFAFHLAFNTDLLTPIDLAFPNTLSSNVVRYNFVAEPGSGCSGEVWLADTISDTAELSLPLVYVLDSVSLALDSITSVTLDSFATDREPAMQLCSIPEQIFQMTPQCGDPLMRNAMRGKDLTFNFISIAPNPASSGDWNVSYNVNGNQELALEVVNVTGKVLYRSVFAGAVGSNNVSVPIPQHPGMYVISITNGWNHKARTAMVVR